MHFPSTLTDAPASGSGSFQTGCAAGALAKRRMYGNDNYDISEGKCDGQGLLPDVPQAEGLTRQSSGRSTLGIGSGNHPGPAQETEPHQPR